MQRIFRPFVVAATVGALVGVPAAALAAEPEGPAKLRAFAASNDKGNGVTYSIKPGQTVPVVAGVTNVGTEGAVRFLVNIRALDDIVLPRTFTNCRYYVSGNMDAAWCRLGYVVPPGAKYVFKDLAITAKPKAKKVGTVFVNVYPDSHGTIDKLAERDLFAYDAPPVAGTVRELELASTTVTPPAKVNSVAFIYTKLVTAPPSSPSPSASASGSSSASPSGSPSAPPATGGAAGGPEVTPTAPSPVAAAGGGDDSALPITGSATASLASAGILLLLAGSAGFVATRRRRARFTA